MSEKERYIFKVLLLGIGALAGFCVFHSSGKLVSAFTVVSGVALGMGYFL